MNLERFEQAQEGVYERALREIRNGRKESHWMWFIFPQIQGLGRSEISMYYAIRDLAETEAYLAHPVLGARLREISGALLELATSDAHAVFGSPDDLKLRSSMTLFHFVSGEAVFGQVLDKFFGGMPDRLTVGILNGSSGDHCR